MKSKVLLILASLLAFLPISLSSCSDDVEIEKEDDKIVENEDFLNEKDNGIVAPSTYGGAWNLELIIYVQDKLGRNLLDASIPGNLLDRQMLMVYNDTAQNITFKDKLRENPLGENVKVGYTTWDGAVISNKLYDYEFENGAAILIGSFRNDKFMKEKFELNLDGKTFSFAFTSKFFIIDENKKATRSNVLNQRKYYLNGVSLKETSVCLDTTYYENGEKTQLGHPDRWRDTFTIVL